MDVSYSQYASLLHFFLLYIFIIILILLVFSRDERKITRYVENNVYMYILMEEEYIYIDYGSYDSILQNNEFDMFLCFSFFIFFSSFIQ